MELFEWKLTYDSGEEIITQYLRPTAVFEFFATNEDAAHSIAKIERVVEKVDTVVKCSQCNEPATIRVGNICYCSSHARAYYSR